MTCEEFSNEFDTLINSYNSTNNYGIVLDEYEKSVYLTRAQEQLIMSLYDGKNASYDSFEKTEEMRRSLSNLICTCGPLKTSYTLGLSSYSTFYQLPESLWFITYEAATLDDSSLNCYNGSTIEIVPITQDEYHKIKKNPFRGSNKRRAFRLDVEGNIVEIISKYKIKNYIIRYLVKPDPIILIDLPEGLSINNISAKTECKVNEILHRSILNLAVSLAIASRASK